MINYEEYLRLRKMSPASITEAEESQLREYRQSIIETIKVDGHDSLDELLDEVNELLGSIVAARAEMHAAREYDELYEYDEDEPWWCR